MKVIVQREDGTEVDITEGVQVLYDSITSSMDWGSGFLDAEEVAHVRAVQVACGFEMKDYSEDACQTCGHRVDRHSYITNGRACRWTDWDTRGRIGTEPPPTNCSCKNYVSPTQQVATP